MEKSLYINYADLKLGDANYIRIYNNSQYENISDIVFGLERLVWGMNKVNSYFSNFSPLTNVVNRLNINIIDSIRTSILMAIFGIQDGKKKRSLS